MLYSEDVLSSPFWCINSEGSHFRNYIEGWESYFQDVISCQHKLKIQIYVVHSLTED